MKRICVRSIVCLTILCLPVAHAATRNASIVDQPRMAEAATAYDRLPLSFEANQGQSDGRVKFLSRGSGYSLFLTGDEAVLALNKPEKKTAPGAHLQPAALATRRPKSESEAVLRMRLVGANAAAQVTGLEELPGRSNYFIGNDPAKWRTDVPNYAKVKYANVYPDVDLVYYGNQRQLEFDLVVQPGGDPKAVRLDFRATVNGKHAALRIDEQGDLIVGTNGGEVIYHKPVVYQMTTNDEARVAHENKIDGKFVLTGAHQVRFQIAAYDRRTPLVIDPTLAYSTYLGGSGSNSGTGIAVDASGNAYVIGDTSSTDFPITPGAFQTTFKGGMGGSASFGDVFVSKLNAAGSALLYSTYLGGSQAEFAAGIAVDASGNAYVTGGTGSNNFPTTPGAFQTNKKGGIDVFVSKLNTTGSALLYSTFLGGGVAVGGSNESFGFGIAVDDSGDAYVTGETGAADFPFTPGVLQRGVEGNIDSFVTKLNPAGSALVYSTGFGGASAIAKAIAIDAAGNAYLTGFTFSPYFPTAPGAFQTTSGGNGDAFVSKLNATGSALLYSTYLGGTGDEGGGGIAIDASGNAYVTGSTDSRNFPTTPGAFQTSLTSLTRFSNAFVSKLNASGSALLYSTYLGGSGFESGSGIAIDASGNAYVTGSTFSSNFPITPGAFQTTLPGLSNAFFSRLNAAGSALLYSTYLGGGNVDNSHGIAVDASGNAYVTGESVSPNFPTTPGAFQTTFGGFSDAFISKFSFGVPFCSFKSKLELDVDGDRDDGFELSSRFALGTGGNIHPRTQPVTLTIGRYSVTIPAYSFVKREEGYEFAGVIHGVRLAVLIRARHSEEGDRGDDEENDDGGKHHERCATATYTVLAKGSGAKLKATTNPVTVTLSIGDNTGTTQVHAEFER